MLSDDFWRARLREAVDATGKKHSWIAREARIAPATLSRILTGKHRHPTFESVVRVAYVCEVWVAWVLGEPGRGIELTEQERKTLRAAREILLRLE
jgi:transcriptional regulator with XRE-family HTH domain